MNTEISGRIALVTGASRGIGRAIAQSLARAGVDVTVNFQVREKEAQEVCAEIKRLGRRVLALQADVSQAEEVSRLVKTIEKELGTISILINNAGISKPRGLEESIRARPDRIPIGRLGAVEEVADVALMLVGNGYMTGQTIQVNGGLYQT
jgi:3-oxoacyl-[acyl-carrier protein] reductase